MKNSLKGLVNEVKIKLNEDKGKNILKTILKKDYKQFVASLGKHVKDPKFIAAIEKLSDKAPVKTSAMAPACTDLRPTQNEVVMANSLSYPLKDPASAEASLKGGVVAPAGRSIVTGGGGTFVIDGHHRWSQVFCINPEAKIKAMDLTDIKEPMEALKATQLGIAAQTGDVPKASGGGVNLFTVGQDELKKYVISTITEPVVDVFAKYGKGDTPETVANYIWENVKVLKSTSKPVTGAPKRDVRPQTDDAPQWVDNTFNVEKLPETFVRRLKKLMTYNKK
jgi:hypothetical protein